MDLALNNLQRLICHKTQPKQTNSPKTLNDKNHQASSQKFRQLTIKGYSTFPKLQSWSLNIRLRNVKTGHSFRGGLTPLQRSTTGR